MSVFFLNVLRKFTPSRVTVVLGWFAIQQGPSVWRGIPCLLDLQGQEGPKISKYSIHNSMCMKDITLNI